MRYSIFSLLRQTLSSHRGWTSAWRDAAPKQGYDVVIVGGGGHGAAASDGLNRLAASLRQVIDDLATLSDQTSSYAVLRLTGPSVRDALAKFVPLDLHTRVFDPGSAASTIASHVPVTLWRLADGADGSAVFEIAAPRSYASSFWHVVTESAAEFGFVRE